jgi:hypothetical protein
MKSPDLLERSGDWPIGEGKRLAAFLHCDQSNRASQPRRRQPAYAKQLAEARRNGFIVEWIVLALDWNIGFACPRLVIDPGLSFAELDLRVVAGLECVVGHRGEPSRALSIAAAALRCGAVCAPVIDLVTSRVTSTSEVRAAMGVDV